MFFPYFFMLFQPLSLWSQPFGFNDLQFWNLEVVGLAATFPDDFIRVFPEDGYSE
jgi:hypothetical protein